MVFRSCNFLLPMAIWRLESSRPVHEFYFLRKNGYPIRHMSMMTSSNGNIFRVTGPLCGEFTGAGEFPTQRPVTRSFDVFFDLRLNKRLSKQPWGWWFETPSRSLWRHCNASIIIHITDSFTFTTFMNCLCWLRAHVSPRITYSK